MFIRHENKSTTGSSISGINRNGTEREIKGRGRRQIRIGSTVV